MDKFLPKKVASTIIRTECFFHLSGFFVTLNMLSYLKHGVSNARNQNYLLLIDKIFNELESPMISVQKVSRSSLKIAGHRPAIFQKL